MDPRDIPAGPAERKRLLQKRYTRYKVMRAENRIHSRKKKIFSVLGDEPRWMWIERDLHREKVFAQEAWRKVVGDMSRGNENGGEEVEGGRSRLSGKAQVGMYHYWFDRGKGSASSD